MGGGVKDWGGGGMGGGLETSLHPTPHPSPTKATTTTTTTHLHCLSVGLASPHRFSLRSNGLATTLPTPAPADRQDSVWICSLIGVTDPNATFGVGVVASSEAGSGTPTD